VDSLREVFGKSMLLVDCGNIHSLKKKDVNLRDAEFILDIMNHQGYDVSSFGPKDFHLVDSTRTQLVAAADFDWVGTNYAENLRPKDVREFVIKKVDGLKVGLFSWVDPNYRSNGIDSTQLVDNLQATVKSLRSKCDVLVMIAHTSNREPEPIAQLVPEVDLMILGGVSGPWSAARQDSTVWIGNSGDRGRHIAQFELLLNRNKEIVETQYSLLKLIHDMPRDPDVVDMMLKYTEKQKAQKLAQLEIKRLQRVSELGLELEDIHGNDLPFAFTGEKECRTCHMKIYNAWRRTNHGRAFSDLIRARESHVEKKVKRTVTGYMERTGYLNRTETNHLYNVQCESCHGRGSAHVASEGLNNEGLVDPETTCVLCHAPDMDPDFDLRSALKSVHDVSQDLPKGQVSPGGKIASKGKPSPANEFLSTKKTKIKEKGKSAVKLQKTPTLLKKKSSH
jgi:hypothetical protein